MLHNLRQEINEIDSEILKLLKRRSEVVLKVGKYKKENNLEVDDFIREINHLKNLNKLNESLYSEEDINSIFTAIFIASKKLQKERK